MPVNKNALIRYQILDTCFRNTMRDYSVQNLIEAIDDVMVEIDPNYCGISRKQIYSDISFMKSAEGWSVDLAKTRKNRNVYYRYVDPDFSINTTSLRENEIELIQESLNFITRFQGMPEYDAIKDIALKLGCRKQKMYAEPFVIFDHNPYLHGLENFSNLFFAIKNHYCIDVHYQNFHESAKMQTVSPYFLKEYNLRWFLVAYSHPKSAIRIYALDRIAKIEKNNEKHQAEFRPDVADFFDDVIGVTRFEEFEVEEYVLKIDKSSYFYVLTKPLHHSQKVIEKNEDYIIFSVKLKYNYEFQKLVLSFGCALEVLKPHWFRLQIKEVVNQMKVVYKQ